MALHVLSSSPSPAPACAAPRPAVIQPEPWWIGPLIALSMLGSVVIGWFVLRGLLEAYLWLWSL